LRPATPKIEIVADSSGMAMLGASIRRSLAPPHQQPPPLLLLQA
jgi:hypothetical protein